MNKMAKEFEVVLDECIDRLNKGEKLEACLADYPEHAKQLQPLLQSMQQVQKPFEFKPSLEAERKGRQLLYAALDKKQKPSFWAALFGRKEAWIAAASMVLVILAAYFSLKYTVFDGDKNLANQPTPTGVPSNTPITGTTTPGTTPGQTTTPGNTGTPEPTTSYVAMAGAGGNFVFMVSDEVNAIADFERVDVTIDKVSLLKSGDNATWIEFVPSTRTFDLARLPGTATQELWQGNIPLGQYSKVVINVSSVSGVLKSSGETVDIKLPSNKLQMNIPFEVSANNVTSFVYDLTVVNTGNGKVNEKYLLKPQIGESGASQKPIRD